MSLMFALSGLLEITNGLVMYNDLMTCFLILLEAVAVRQSTGAFEKQRMFPTLLYAALNASSLPF